MNNFEFKHNGESLWYSRAVAVVGLILAHDYIWDWYVLANKRGKNTPDFQGYWSLPCGYLDFNETCEEAIIREIFEETGLKIQKDRYLDLIGVDSIPVGKQNVTIRFKCNMMEGITMADKIIINNSRPGSQINIVSGNAKINASQTIITSKNETTIVNNKDVKK